MPGGRLPDPPSLFAFVLGIGWFVKKRVSTHFPSTMAQNCFGATILVSLATRPKPRSELEGLVYGITESPREEGVSWYRRTIPLAVAFAIVCGVLNLLFW